MNKVTITSIPYPYRAMLAICSDLDETKDADTYFDTVRYLNTAGMTKHGKGLELEIGNTIYFDMPPGQFSYWNCDDSGRTKIRKLIQSGHIDCFHSFGDLTVTRDQVKQHIAELEKNDCRLTVWIDHAQAATNLDPGIMLGSGNRPGADAYHSDLIAAHGVRYVWLGRVTSVLGQDVHRRLGGIWDAGYPIRSSLSLSKEIVKGWLPLAGHSKYQMHAENQIMRPTVLADGSPVWEFIRCNPSPLGVSSQETGDGIGHILNHNFFDRLVRQQGKCILYTHLGKLSDPDNCFNNTTTKSFELLKEYYQSRQILVTTTRRLLDYACLTRNLHVETELNDNVLTIRLSNSDNLPLDGLSLLVESTVNHFEIYYNKRVVKNYSHMNHKGINVVSFDWCRLECPDI